jgi:ABC-2 type transport system ATP-binding protein
VLLTTQYLEEADRLADEIVIIDGGRTIAGGKPEQLKALVDGTHFTLTTATDAEFTRLRALLPHAVSSPETRTVDFRVDTTSLAGLQAIIATVTAANIPIAGYATRQPTLDDAFLQLTGRHK